jgi:hypothetical protein
VKEKCKNSATPSKEKTQKAWDSKKDKRCKPKGYLIYSSK